MSQNSISIGEMKHLQTNEYDNTLKHFIALVFADSPGFSFTMRVSTIIMQTI